MKLSINKISSASSSIYGNNNGIQNQQPREISVTNVNQQPQMTLENEIMELQDTTNPTNDNKILELQDRNPTNLNNGEDFERMLEKEVNTKQQNNRREPTKETPKRGGRFFGNQQKKEKEPTKKKKNYGNYLVIGSIIGILGSYLMN